MKPKTDSTLSCDEPSMGGVPAKRSILVVGVLMLTGCLGAGGPDPSGGDGDVFVQRVQFEPPVEPSPITAAEMESVPELRRLLATAMNRSRDPVHTEVGPDTADRIGDFLKERPYYGGGSSRYRPNGTYIRHDGTIVLVRFQERGFTTLVRPYPNASGASVNDLEAGQLENITALHALVKESVRRDEPVTEVFSDEQRAEIRAFLKSHRTYRPSYNGHRYWGVYLRYRNATFVVRMKQDQPAT